MADIPKKADIRYVKYIAYYYKQVIWNKELVYILVIISWTCAAHVLTLIRFAFSLLFFCLPYGERRQITRRGYRQCQKETGDSWYRTGQLREIFHKRPCRMGPGPNGFRIFAKMSQMKSAYCKTYLKYHVRCWRVRERRA